MTRGPARAVVVLLAVVAAMPTPADTTDLPEPACPASSVIVATMSKLATESASRTERFGASSPTDLYVKAAAKIDRGFARTAGHEGQGVIVASLGAVELWKAINDETHFTQADYIPVAVSEVIDGSPRGTGRLVFQEFQRWGVGRSWVITVRMNQSLYARSKGRMWELFWEAGVHGFDAEHAEKRMESAKSTALEDNHGTWLLVPLGEQCTLLEYYTYTDPGGALAVLQKMMASGALRNSLEGMVRLAREHIPEPHPGATFVLPDGKRLD